MSNPERRITIQWTSTAKECLRKLPLKVRKGLLDKADELYTCTDPREAHKPLTGPLSGYFRITYGRYRAVYTVHEEKVSNGETVIHVRIIFIAAGIRKERDKGDIYRIAQKVVDLGLIDLDEPPEAT